MDVTLVMFKADGTRRDFPVRKDRIVIGRKNTCGLRIPLSAISRQHCEIRVTDDGIVLKDLGSSNGTYHNSIRVQEAELTAGDELSVGPVVFTVVVDGRPAEIRPVRTVLERTAEDHAADPPDGADQVDQAVEIADLSIDDDADLARELSDELASADELATPSVDEPPAAGLEDSDLDLASAAAGGEPAPPAAETTDASPEESVLDLDALFDDPDPDLDPDDGADADAARKPPSSPTGGEASSILEFDFDELDDI